MTMPTCINNPGSELLLVLRRWQVDICDNNKCAAAVLSFLIYFHDVKREMIRKNKQANDLAELHGDERTQDETIYQFHTIEEITERILGLYGRTAINEGIKLLEKKEIISIHRNPNPKYSFDKTRYFLLHPAVCNEWLEEKYNKNNRFQKRHIDEPENGHRSTGNSTSMNRKTVIDEPEVADRQPQTCAPSTGNSTAITKNTYKEQIDKKIGSDNNFSVDNSDEATEASPEVRAVIDYLVEHGMPRKLLTRTDDICAIQTILKAGATQTDFANALVKAYVAKGEEKFGLYYLLKIISNFLEERKRRQISKQKRRELPEEHSGSLSVKDTVQRPKLEDFTGRTQERPKVDQATIDASLRDIKSILQKTIKNNYGGKDDVDFNKKSR
ncbi:MAG: hypothetical protein KAT71_05200 [Gammaproteobacteria bacterium]|nr:hypothetical protein [Gammaproteobacteria bacterium]